MKIADLWLFSPRRLPDEDVNHGCVLILYLLLPLLTLRVFVLRLVSQEVGKLVAVIGDEVSERA
jgi:hypothetical protein